MLEALRKALRKGGLKKLAAVISYIPSTPTKWVERLAKVGLYTKGVLYCLIGLLALRAALELGSPNHSVNRKSVFLFIEELIFGRVLLGLVAIGLACYCAWRLLQALQDTEHKGTDAKGIAYRLRYAASGMFYGLITLLAAKLAVAGSDGDDSLRQAFVEVVVQRPLGQGLLILGAVAVALAGFYQIYQGVSGRYREKIKEAGWKDDAEETMIKAGKIGYAARGTVWVISAYLLVSAALHVRKYSEGAAVNAFQFLENSFFGSFLVGGAAFGLICYGFFIFMEAKFREGMG